MSFVFVFVIEHTFCFGFLLDIYLIYSIIRYAIAPPSIENMVLISAMVFFWFHCFVPHFFGHSFFGLTFELMFLQA